MKPEEALRRMREADTREISDEELSQLSLVQNAEEWWQRVESIDGCKNTLLSEIHKGTITFSSEYPECSKEWIRELYSFLYK